MPGNSAPNRHSVRTFSFASGTLDHCDDPCEESSVSDAGACFGGRGGAPPLEEEIDGVEQGVVEYSSSEVDEEEENWW